jgi:adenosine deaminase
VRCSLGSDDPLLLGTSLLAEYRLARSQLALVDSQLAALARTSIQSSGAPDHVRTPALHGIDVWLGEP